MGRAEVPDYMGVVCGRGFLRGCTNRVVDLGGGGGLTSAPRACGMRVRLDTRGRVARVVAVGSVCSSDLGGNVPWLFDLDMHHARYIRWLCRLLVIRSSAIFAQTG